MKELVTRALSGAVYIALIIGATIVGAYFYLPVIFVLGFLCLNEFLNLVQAKKLLYFSLYIILGSVAFYVFQFTYVRLILLGFVTAISLLLFLGLTGSDRFKFIYDLKFKPFTIIGYQIIGFSAMSYIPFIYGKFETFLILGLFILIWINDSFAYLTGVSIGKTKLIPSISPNKSVEGFVGGFVATLIASYLLFRYVGVIDLYHWVLYGVIASIVGSVGDLVQSKFKRIAGVKDSGNIMPGHGGIYDRLDSVLYASPFVLLLLSL